MEDHDQTNRNATLSKNSTQKSSRRVSSGRRSQKAVGEHPFPAVLPEKRTKSKKSSKQKNVDTVKKNLDHFNQYEYKIDVESEKTDLLGYEVYTGKLHLDKNKLATAEQIGGAGTTNIDSVDAKLTSKALIWGPCILSLDEVVSVSYHSGVRYFTVHAYPAAKKSFRLCVVGKSQRVQKDFRFLASNVEEAIQWVTCFADQQCYINLLPNPFKQASADFDLSLAIFDLPPIKTKSPPKILVILNPRSGHGRSSKVFHTKAEPIFKLAGFQMEVVKTTHAGHARSLVAAVDFSTCPDGIVCVGGDGIVNEVLNGLLSRSDQKEAISIPIGIIPAGSDNSLVWTVLGVREPISAAMAIVKGGLTPTDVLAVEWINTGLIHFGTTVSYFGFLSDVLELSEKYQKRFGPLRYFVAGFLKFLCLPSYFYELEYLPMSKEAMEYLKKGVGQEKFDLSDLYTDVMRRSWKEGIPRASSLSSIDSIMTPSRVSLGDCDNTSGSTVASTEPSDHVRGIDPKSKRLSLGRNNNIVSEPEEVLHPLPHHLSIPNWPRTRSKTRENRTSTGLTATNELRSSLSTSVHDKEDISSTVSDPGPVWDSEPKWDAEPYWERGSPIELPGPREGSDLSTRDDVVPSLDEKWVMRKGHFLAVLVCNHSCRTVQSLSSQVIAPKAEHDDSSLDLLLIGGRGRFRLLKFLVQLQRGRHLDLPYVEYVKVRSLKLRPGVSTHNGCGIDGELRQVKGQVQCSLLPEQCRLIGRPARDSIQRCKSSNI